MTSRGHIEAQVVGNGVALLAADYKESRWHDKVEMIYIGGVFDDGVVKEIRARD